MYVDKHQTPRRDDFENIYGGTKVSTFLGGDPKNWQILGESNFSLLWVDIFGSLTKKISEGGGLFCSRYALLGKGRLSIQSINSLRLVHVCMDKYLKEQVYLKIFNYRYLLHLPFLRLRRIWFQLFFFLFQQRVCASIEVSSLVSEIYRGRT